MAAIATGRYVTNQTLYVLATRTAQLLRVNRQSLLDALVANPGADGITEAKDQFAQMANRINGMILADIPALRRSSSTVTVTASGQSAAIPSTVHRNQIVDVRYSNSDDPADLVPIRFIGKLDSRRLPAWVMNGQYEAQYPLYVALDSTEANLLFFPFLSTATSFILVFQAAPDLFVGADYDDDASTTYAVVPNEYNNVIPYFLALEMAKIMGYSEKAEMLEVDLMGKPQNGFMGIYETFARAMGEVPDKTNSDKYSYSNQYPAALATPFDGVNFGNGYPYSQ